MDDLSVGPAGQDKLLITPGLSDLIRSHVKYISNLSLFDQFIIWRYTLGSGQVNLTLIGHSDETKVFYWIYNFFRHYNIDHYGRDQIPYPFNRWLDLFISPKNYLAYGDITKKIIANQIINAFVNHLESIILSAPPTPADITVYKVNSPYPELPTELSYGNDVVVYQKPFNSTTYDPQLNFAPFLAPDNCCCFIEILIPKGSKVLSIDPSLHAYPHEREILLPFGSKFDIYHVDQHTLTYIPQEKQPFVQVQQIPFVLGEVYRLDPLSQPDVKQKKIKYYHIKLIP